jgi:hypothetical protein
MMDWLAAHREAANTLISFGMLLVWLVYLHVFTSSYRRQNRANILIAAGAGAGLEARCLVGNLSPSPIYVHGVLLDVRTPTGTIRASVTELEDLERWEYPSDLSLWTRQGPLKPGSVRDMGAFSAMIEHALRKSSTGEAAAGLDAVRAFNLTIVGHYGPDDRIVAAEQTYSVHRAGEGVRLRRNRIAPRQISSRRERIRIEARLERDL